MKIHTASDWRNRSRSKRVQRLFSIIHICKIMQIKNFWLHPKKYQFKNRITQNPKIDLLDRRSLFSDRFTYIYFNANRINLSSVHEFFHGTVNFSRFFYLYNKIYRQLTIHICCQTLLEPLLKWNKKKVIKCKWGSKFGTTKCRTTNISKFQNWWVIR